MTEKMQKRMSIYLFITFAVSSFVSFEPSPYDFLMILFLSSFIIFPTLKMTKAIALPIIMVCLFLLSNLLPLLFIDKLNNALLFTAITFYLAITWICLVIVLQYIGLFNYKILLNGYLLSACISALIGVLAYFHMIPFSETFLLFTRAKAFFKDPNVFGPYLVIPALFALSMIEVKGISRMSKTIYFLSFLLVTSGIILSFSRAAWGNYLISLFIFIFLIKREFIRRRIKTIMLLAVVVVPVFIYLLQSPLVEDLLVSRLSYQSYDDDRFDTQRAALLKGFMNPIGVGGGQSDYVFQYSPHSLYARVFTENGVLGLVSFITILLLSIFKAFKSYWSTKSEDSIFYLIIFASLIGLTFNSFFVDTLHWRHFWLLLAFAWTLPLVKVRKLSGSR